MNKNPLLPQSVKVYQERHVHSVDMGLIWVCFYIFVLAIDISKIIFVLYHRVFYKGRKALFYSQTTDNFLYELMTKINHFIKNQMKQIHASCSNWNCWWRNIPCTPLYNPHVMVIEISYFKHVCVSPTYVSTTFSIWCNLLVLYEGYIWSPYLIWTVGTHPFLICWKYYLVHNDV